MKRDGVQSPVLGALVAMIALVLLAQGASAQDGSCSATSPCPDSSNCCSQYGYCGTGSANCGAGCVNGPCEGACSATNPCPDSSNYCSQYGYCGTTSTYYGAGCINGPCTGTTPSPPPPSSPNGGSGWSSFLTEATFDQMFPYRLAFYIYANMQTGLARETHPCSLQPSPCILEICGLIVLRNRVLNPGLRCARPR